MSSFTPSSEGQKIKIDQKKNELQIPDNPVIPFIEGDGTGPDIWRASRRVFDAAVKKAYNGNKKIVWFEVLAGEKAYNKLGTWLPDETLENIKGYIVAIQGPLPTPVGGGIRSLNVRGPFMATIYPFIFPSVS